MFNIYPYFYLLSNQLKIKDPESYLISVIRIQINEILKYSMSYTKTRYLLTLNNCRLFCSSKKSETLHSKFIWMNISNKNSSITSIIQTACLPTSRVSSRMLSNPRAIVARDNRPFFLERRTSSSEIDRAPIASVITEDRWLARRKRSAGIGLDVYTYLLPGVQACIS